MSCSKLRTADDTRETARPASPARPVRPHAVDVVLGHERQVIVDDERQLHNAEPARGKVGGTNTITRPTLKSPSARLRGPWVLLP